MAITIFFWPRLRPRPPRPPRPPLRPFLGLRGQSLFKWLVSWHSQHFEMEKKFWEHYVLFRLKILACRMLSILKVNLLLSPSFSFFPPSSWWIALFLSAKKCSVAFKILYSLIVLEKSGIQIPESFFIHKFLVEKLSRQLTLALACFSCKKSSVDFKSLYTPFVLEERLFKGGVKIPERVFFTFILEEPCH